jgi:hypothetical protein
VPFILKPYCNSFAIATKNPEDALEWHGLVTCEPHISGIGIQT